MVHREEEVRGLREEELRVGFVPFVREKALGGAGGDFDEGGLGDGGAAAEDGEAGVGVRGRSAFGGMGWW